MAIAYNGRLLVPVSPRMGVTHTALFVAATVPRVDETLVADLSAAPEVEESWLGPKPHPVENARHAISAGKRNLGQCMVASATAWRSRAPVLSFESHSHRAKVPRAQSSEPNVPCSILPGKIRLKIFLRPNLPGLPALRRDWKLSTIDLADLGIWEGMRRHFALGQLTWRSYVTVNGHWGKVS